MGFSGLVDTWKVLANPERFLHGMKEPFFTLAGRSVTLGEGPPPEGIFLPEPLFEASAVQYQPKADRQHARQVFQESLHGIGLTAFADCGARSLQDPLLQLRIPFRVELLGHIRRTFLQATLQMLMGQAIPPSFFPLWETWLSTLHPLLLFPPHPWFRCCGPWSRSLAARTAVREALIACCNSSTQGSPAARMRSLLQGDALVDQLLLVLLGSSEQPAIHLAWALSERAKHPEEGDGPLLDRVQEEHPMLLIPRKDGLVVHKRQSRADQVWPRTLLLAALRTLRPYVQGHHVQLGPQIRQRYFWGPGAVWLTSS